VSVEAVRDVIVAAMADDGTGNGGNGVGGGGKGALGELVKAESMIQLAIALPAA
jgi:ATP synthase protein I